MVGESSETSSTTFPKPPLEPLINEDRKRAGKPPLPETE